MRVPPAGSAAALVVLACGGGESTSIPNTPLPSPPPLVTAPLTIVSGAGTTDTVLAVLGQPLVVVLHTPTGAVRVGVPVRFDALPPVDTSRRSEHAIAVARSAAFAASATDTTDANGQAKVLVAFGTVSGAARIAVTTAEGVSDTAAFTVLAGTPVKLAFPWHDTAMVVRSSLSVAGVARDAFGNTPATPPALTLSVVSGSAPASVSAGNVVQGDGYGRARLIVKAAGLADTAFISVVPSGRLVAITSDWGDPYLVNVDGSQRRWLRQPGGLVPQKWAPHWAPDGARFIVIAGLPPLGGQLTMVDTNGTYRTVRPGTPRGDNAATYSRDGQWIYFTNQTDFPVARSELGRIHPDGTGYTVLATTYALPYWQNPDPSPDGTTLLVDRSAFASSTEARFDVATGAFTSLFATMGRALYSPAGDSVVVQSADGGLYLAAANGAGIRPVSAIGERYEDRFSWSPDGNWIIARSQTLGRLMVIQISTGLTIPLPIRDLVMPAWQPKS